MKHLASIFSYRFNRRLFQVTLYALLSIPLCFGLAGALFGTKSYSWILGVPINLEPTLDSDLRFLAVIFFGIAAVIAWIIPRIEKNTAIFRIAAGSIILGGIARLISVFVVGAPNMITWLLIAVEIIIVPLCILWQWQIAKAPKR